MMGVHTGAALLLCFVVGSNGIFWYKDCLVDKQKRDPRVCGSDGVTYQTPCDFSKFSPEWAQIIYSGPCKENWLPPKQYQPFLPPPTKYSEEDYIEYETTQTTPRYSEENIDDYVFPTPQQPQTTPRYSEEDIEDYVFPTPQQPQTTPIYSEEVDEYEVPTRPTRPKTRKPTPPKNIEEDNEYELDLVINKPSINVDIHNNANNHNNIEVGPNTHNMNPTLNNNAENTNNINIGRYAPFPYLYSVKIRN